MHRWHIQLTVYIYKEMIRYHSDIHRQTVTVVRDEKKEFSYVDKNK